MSSESGPMTVEKGYKVTEVGVIPEEWEVTNLSSACSRITDGSHFSPPATNLGYFMASVKDMTRKGFDFSKCKIISESDHRKLVAQGCKPIVGDVLIAKDGATLLEQVFVQKKEDDITVLSSIAILRTIKDKLDSTFLSQFLSWNYIKDKVRKEFTSGSALPRIILKNFRLIAIPLPPLPEQEKIAEILSTVDEHIGETEDLIEKTETLKRGMMQRLLTQGIGHTEFKDTEIGVIPEEWEVVRLASIARLINGRAYRQEELLDKGKYPVLRVGNFFTSDKWYYSDLELDEEKYCSQGDLLYAWSASFGPRIWRGSKVVYHYHIWKILPKNNLDKCFAHYMLLRDVHKIKNETNGSTMGHLTKKNMEDRLFVLPGYSEQREIAEILTAIDDRIEEYRSKLEALTRLKSGLMQQLLTGRIRVRV